MTELERTAQKIHKRHAKTSKRRWKLRIALADLDRAEYEQDLADLGIFSEAAQREINSRVLELDREESKDYNDPSQLAESGEE